MDAYRILYVNLDQETIVTRDIDEAVMRKYIGGEGIAAKILWEETGADTDPLSPENPLIFITGPLTGTRVPGSGRHTVAAISPLTGIWGAGHAGGTWGHALRHTPYFGIVFKGRARRPVYLWIDNEKAELRDASHVWGKDSFETDDLLRGETEPRASVATIGQAGERLVRIASVMNDGRAARAAARSGMGAVMGSKMLKAVVVRGTVRPRVYDEEGLKKSIGQNFPKTYLDLESYKQSRIGSMSISNRGPIKNWTLGEFKGFDEKRVEAMYSRGEPYYCRGCPVGCFITMFSGQRNVNGEHLGPVGSNCLIDNFTALDEAYELCNRYGLDTISTGGIIGFAMELYEKGLITSRDTEGIPLNWGNHEAMLQMVRNIGEREGFGELLGQGVRKVAEVIGGNACEYAMHVKGLETSYHDPRYQNATALIDATGNRGADHMDGFVGRTSPGYALPYLPDEEARRAAQDLFSTEGVEKFVAWSQDFGNVLECLGICKFVVAGDLWLRQPVEPPLGVKPPHLVDWLNHVTGWDMDLEEMMRVGERSFNLKRAFNVRRGISRKDDILPARFLTLKRGGKSIAADNLPHLGAMLNEYYRWRGWSEEGIPTQEKLTQLGLEVLGMIPSAKSSQ